jgi:hypothetical protein
MWVLGEGGAVSGFDSVIIFCFLPKNILYGCMISRTVFFNNMVTCYTCVKSSCQVYADYMGGWQCAYVLHCNWTQTSLVWFYSPVVQVRRCTITWSSSHSAMCTLAFSWLACTAWFVCWCLWIFKTGVCHNSYLFLFPNFIFQTCSFTNIQYINVPCGLCFDPFSYYFIVSHRVVYHSISAVCSYYLVRATCHANLIVHWRILQIFRWTPFMFNDNKKSKLFS